MAWVTGFTEESLRGERARWLTAFAVALWGVCFLRLAYLQLIRGHTLEQASENNHTQILMERAPRGRILDRNGHILADDQPVFVALFSPFGLSPNDFQQAVDRLSIILPTPKSELERRLRSALRAKSMVRISDRLDRAQAFLILQDRIHLPGISLTIEEQRTYPHGTLASHVLGYVGQMTDEEVEHFSKEGYHPGDWIGKSGLERLYDPLLHGQDGGFLMEVDALGRQVRVIRHLLPQVGKDLILTLNYRLESLAEDRLRRTKHPGAAIVMNPQSGEVLALASSPGFDPNLFLPLGNSEKRTELLTNPDLPLYNRAIQALYPPGSVFKIISALAGLEHGKMEPDEKVKCRGSFVLGLEKRIFHCWNLKGHGRVDFTQAFAQSCDVYFYQLGLGMGPEPMEQMAKGFGLGQRTSIDLLSEKKGSLPLALKKSLGQHWQGGDTLNYAIGQGALQVTPFQMAMVISTVANRGAIWQPFIVSESHRFGEQNERISNPHPMSHVTASESSWNSLQKGLVEAVRTGTGAAAQLKDVVVAGKTGTAQTPKGKEHGWFVAYAPADHPQVACAVLVEHGGHGGSVAAPIAHDLLAMALGVEEANANAGVSESQGD